MKASQKGRVRPTLRSYSQTPHSITQRVLRLPNKTAADLLTYLCRMTIGFGRGSTDLTYSKLAEALHKDWSTIARAAKLLRRMGDVEVEALENGSYRWYVLLEAEDIVADPEGLYRVRGAQVVAQPTTPHGENAMGSWRSCHGGYGTNAMGGMAQTPWGQDGVAEGQKPLLAPEEAALEVSEKEPLKIFLKDTSLKIYHQNESDDGPLDYKKILGELIALGTGQRMARKLLRDHDHGLIAGALERVRHRSDLENRAGYLIREVEDGGYKSVSPSPSVKPSDNVSRETSTTPRNGHERTRAEFKALEAEKARKEIAYRQEVQALLQRFQTLPEDLKAQLKTRWKHHLESLVPNTSRKAVLMEDQRFQKIAFKEVTANFFALLDQGLSTDRALAQLAA